MRRILFLLILLCTFSSCGEKAKPERRVGVDPSWYPLELGPQANSVTAFSTEILTTIGRLEQISFVKVTVNWDDLMEGLQKNRYEAILSSKPPYIFNMKFFDFSEIYLPLGPVLVVGTNSSLDSIDHLAGKEIAVIPGSSSALILEKSRGVLIRTYDSIPAALNDTLLQTVDGAMIDYLSAVIYCRDLYQGMLKIATPPLNGEGLRLVTKHDAAPDLIKGFNEGLKKMKKDGSYDDLLNRWGLQAPTSKKT
jgi:polar amino acid transport system substrate-binding protein